MDMRRLVGRNFARLRTAKGFTQERFAEQSGFTQQYVSGLERVRRNPTVISLFLLANALGVTPVELVAARLEREGWQARHGGDHDVYKHPAWRGRIIVPRHRTLSLGVARVIAKQAGWLD